MAVQTARANAVSEAFNSTIKVEYIHLHKLSTRQKARTKISNWITGVLQPTSPSQRLRRHVTIHYERYMAGARDSTAS